MIVSQDKSSLIITSVLPSSWPSGEKLEIAEGRASPAFPLPPFVSTSPYFTESDLQVSIAGPPCTQTIPGKMPLASSFVAVPEEPRLTNSCHQPLTLEAPTFPGP